MHVTLQWNGRLISLAPEQEGTWSRAEEVWAAWSLTLVDMLLFWLHEFTAEDV